MLEKPDFPDEKIVACLRNAHRLSIDQVTFLPLGADLNTVVYRADARDGRPYFVKLWRGNFDETSATLPKFLQDQGIAAILAPLPTPSGQLWVELDDFKLILYPFVAGHNGYEVDLNEQHWHTFGAALQQVHTIPLPATLRRSIQSETYPAHGRETIRIFLERVERETWSDPVAQQVVALLQAQRIVILDLVRRAEELAHRLQENPPEFVMCHSDVHAGNILIGLDGAFYIVDWDNPILAPKERDLMFPGGGQGFRGRSLPEEERLFYEGYGPTLINPAALAYYRYERIVQDIAIYCEQLLLSDAGGPDREQSLGYLKSNFLPGNTIEVAYRTGR
jgi:spectinomycin phosphotransferase